ncbi:MAG: hypothetical protein M1838_006246 [Thelocarpon superellum]|nr:MAG: hypothetical protein M1838_006246 [Thelocarpon superellum]
MAQQYPVASLQGTPLPNIVFTRYLVEPARDVSDPEDYTSFVPEQATWTEWTLPAIAGQLRPASNFSGLLGISLTKLYEGQTPVTDGAGRQLNDFPFLPRRISRQVESWRLEMWFRMDTRLSYNDIWGRMAPGERRPRQSRSWCNGLNMSRTRWREANKAMCWVTRRDHITKTEVKTLEHLSEAQVAANTNWILQDDGSIVQPPPPQGIVHFQAQPFPGPQPAMTTRDLRRMQQGQRELARLLPIAASEGKHWTALDPVHFDRTWTDRKTSAARSQANAASGGNVVTSGQAFVSAPNMAPAAYPTSSFLPVNALPAVTPEGVASAYSLIPLAPPPTSDLGLPSNQGKRKHGETDSDDFDDSNAQSTDVRAPRKRARNRNIPATPGLVHAPNIPSLTYPGEPSQPQNLVHTDPQQPDHLWLLSQPLTSSSQNTVLPGSGQDPQGSGRAGAGSASQGPMGVGGHGAFPDAPGFPADTQLGGGVAQAPSPLSGSTAAVATVATAQPASEGFDYPADHLLPTRDEDVAGLSYEDWLGVVGLTAYEQRVREVGPMTWPAWRRHYSRSAWAIYHEDLWRSAGRSRWLQSLLYQPAPEAGPTTHGGGWQQPQGAATDAGHFQPPHGATFQAGASQPPPQAPGLAGFYEPAHSAHQAGAFVGPQSDQYGAVIGGPFSSGQVGAMGGASVGLEPALTYGMGVPVASDGDVTAVQHPLALNAAGPYPTGWPAGVEPEASGGVDPTDAQIDPALLGLGLLLDQGQRGPWSQGVEHAHEDGVDFTMDLGPDDPFVGFDDPSLPDVARGQPGAGSQPSTQVHPGLAEQVRGPAGYAAVPHGDSGLARPALTGRADGRLRHAAPPVAPPSATGGNAPAALQGAVEAPALPPAIYSSASVPPHSSPTASLLPYQSPDERLSLDAWLTQYDLPTTAGYQAREMGETTAGEPETETAKIAGNEAEQGGEEGVSPGGASLLPRPPPSGTAAPSPTTDTPLPQPMTRQGSLSVPPLTRQGSTPGTLGVPTPGEATRESLPSQHGVARTPGMTQAMPSPAPTHPGAPEAPATVDPAPQPPSQAPRRDAVDHVRFIDLQFASMTPAERRKAGITDAMHAARLRRLGVLEE